jgi:hypothetical protein
MSEDKTFAEGDIVRAKSLIGSNFENGNLYRVIKVRPIGLGESLLTVFNNKGKTRDINSCCVDKYNPVFRPGQTIVNWFDVNEYDIPVGLLVEVEHFSTTNNGMGIVEFLDNQKCLRIRPARAYVSLEDHNNLKPTREQLGVHANTRVTDDMFSTGLIPLPIMEPKVRKKKVDYTKIGGWGSWA